MFLVHPQHSDLSHCLTKAEAIKLGTDFEQLLRLSDSERRVEEWPKGFQLTP